MGGQEIRALSEGGTIARHMAMQGIRKLCKAFTDEKPTFPQRDPYGAMNNIIPAMCTSIGIQSPDL
jgi:hypothetical protein